MFFVARAPGTLPVRMPSRCMAQSDVDKCAARWEKAACSWTCRRRREIFRLNKAESRKQKAEGRRQKLEGRRQKAEGRRQKAEARRQKAEGRRQKAEGRSFSLRCCRIIKEPVPTHR